ncbi:retinol dehydrogenase 12-like [Asterias amurensis]|uniref:retinol dehydrogenase 12-like n=1 Tax=Asterias amurensis TaxID=7602 RepID=UPI003AB352FD
MGLEIFGCTVDPFLVAAYIVVSVVILWLVRKWSDGGWCYSKARLDGKTIIITGANTGIGKETARDFAKRGARVILACRDLAKAEAAVTEICKETGSNNLVVRKLDLASLASIRAFAEKIKAEETRLDILVNNAGIMMCPEWKTEDGFEMQLGVNHLGHFLLTNLLLDLIKSSSPSRIVNVASLAHIWGKMHWDDLMMRSGYDALLSYGQSKLANILFSKELSKRLAGSGVSVYSLHPGSVRTELTRYFNQGLKFPLSYIFSIITSAPIRMLVFKSAVQGAQTSIYCSVTEELKDVTGMYYSDCAEVKPNRLAQDEESGRRLWEVSAELVGLEKKME